MENGKTEVKPEVAPAEKPEVASEEKPLVKAEIEVTKEIKDDKVTEEAEKPVEKPEEVTPELLERIKSQIEFYFGDANMQRDKFLIEQSKLDEGWIPMSIMLKFKALASISQNVEAILKAIGASELMEISEDKKKIRRNPAKPLPVYDDAYRKAQNERSVYCKGFPLEGITIQILQNFFKDFEPSENIVMRKYPDKDKNYFFKGSIFIQFKTLDDAKAFMARESVKYGDKELIRKYKEDYLVEKAKEREEIKAKKDGKAKKTDEKEEEKIEAEEVDDGPGLPKGAVLHFSGAIEGVEREIIKAAFTKFPGHFSEQIAYIDFEKGDTEGMVRFQGEDTAKKCFEKFGGDKLELDICSLTFRLLEGDEEEEYLKKVKGQMLQKRQHIKNKRGRPKRGRGGGARGKKRGGSPNRDAPPKKTAKSS